MTEITKKERNNFIRDCHMNFEGVKKAVENSPDIVNSYNEKMNESGLGAAGHMGNREIAEYLLANGAPLELAAAAMLGMNKEVQAYLDKDAELANSAGPHGISVAFHAALSGDPEIMQLLWDAGAEDAVKKSLIGAVNKGHLELVKWLLAHDADTSVTNFQDKTALVLAEEKGFTEIVELIQSPN
ncbi:MAG: ankyrin repeat domain-containing protein [Chloroflexota bacterium]